MRHAVPALLSATLIAACSDASTSSPAADTATATDTHSSDGASSDTPEPSDTPDPSDTADPADTTDPADVGSPDAEPTDVADTSEPDTSAPEVVAAVVGERCALAERIGIVELSGITDPTPMPYVSASLFDRPNPWYGEPVSTTEQCRFHQFSPEGVCDGCTAEELCAVDGTCVPAPRRLKDAVVLVTAGDEAQKFTADPELGYLEGALTLAGSTFGVAVTFGTTTITLAEVEAPPPIGGLSGTVAGAWDKPTGVHIIWTPAATGTEIFTHIPINHHAAGPTFTECTVDASVGTLHVNGDMLTPLAVVTGLEFQGIEHMRVAAAHVAAGCVEFRFTTRQYVSLEPD